MASTGVYTSDKELEDLYNSLEKGSLVKMLIEKHSQLEKQVKKLTIHVVSCCVCETPTPEKIHGIIKACITCKKAISK